MVEEITHASLYHGLIPNAPSCRDITVLQNEFIAKYHKIIWMALSGIPPIFFSNVTEVKADFGGALDLAVGSNANAKAFLNCPPSGTTPRSNIFTNIICTNEFVQQHMLLALL